MKVGFCIVALIIPFIFCSCINHLYYQEYKAEKIKEAEKSKVKKEYIVKIEGTHSRFYDNGAMFEIPYIQYARFKIGDEEFIYDGYDESANMCIDNIDLIVLNKKYRIIDGVYYVRIYDYDNTYYSLNYKMIEKLMKELERKRKRLEK